MRDHEKDEYWYLEQWGLWSRSCAFFPKGYKSENSEGRDRWEITDDDAMDVNKTLRGMEYPDMSIIRRFYKGRDSSVDPDRLQISINRFAVAHGIPGADQLCTDHTPLKPRKMIARRRPGPYVFQLQHPNQGVQRIKHMLGRKPLITLGWLKTGV